MKWKIISKRNAATTITQINVKSGIKVQWLVIMKPTNMNDIIKSNYGTEYFIEIF